MENKDRLKLHLKEAFVHINRIKRIYLSYLMDLNLKQKI